MSEPITLIVHPCDIGIAGRLAIELHGALVVTRQNWNAATVGIEGAYPDERGDIAATCERLMPGWRPIWL